MSEAGQPGSFLGTGWAFPPSFGKAGGEVALTSGVDNVHRSLLILLRTRTSERAMQEGYGCDLDAALFEKIDQGLVNRLSSMISNAILEHEPRIKLSSIDVSRSKTDASVLDIRLSYVVRATNSRYNLVFPFYLNEAVVPGL